MLKPSRWLSIVFQHWNTCYFEAILEEAAHSGASLKAAVTQTGDTIWSMHKKKNKERVLAGEMILSFVKDGKGRLPRPRTSYKPRIDGLIDEVLAKIAPDGMPFAGELLFNEIVLTAWKRGVLHPLDLTREDFSEILRYKGWRYNTGRHLWFKAEDGIRSGFQLRFWTR